MTHFPKAFRFITLLSPWALSFVSPACVCSQQSLSGLAFTPYEKIPQRRRALSFSSLDPRLLRFPTMSVPNNVNTQGLGLNSPFNSSPSLYSPTPPSTGLQASPSSSSLASNDPQSPATPTTSDVMPSPTSDADVGSPAVSPEIASSPVAQEGAAFHVPVDHAKLSRGKSSLGISTASSASVATDNGRVPTTADKDRSQASDAVRAKLAAIGHQLR